VLSNFRSNLSFSFLTILIILPSFFYGGNNSFSFIFCNCCLLIYFLINFEKIDFKILKYQKSIFTVYFFFLFYLIFQLLPNFNFFFKNFSPQHLYLYNSVTGVTYKPIALNPYIGIQNLIFFFVYFLVFLLVPKIVQSKRSLSIIFQILIIVGLIHVLFGLFIELFDLVEKNFIFYEKKYYLSSLTGFFINRNNFSFFLLIIFIVNFYFLGFYKKYFVFGQKYNSKFFQFITSNLLIYRLSLLFISVGIILTKSRAGNFSFIVILILITIFEFIRHKKISFNILLIVSIILIDLLVVSNILGLDGLLNRIVATSIDGEASRFNVFIFGLKEFLNFPLFGYGYGGFEILYRLNYDVFNTFYNHVHNDFIQFLGEYGIFGAILFIMLLFSLIINFAKNYKNNIYELNIIIILSFVVMIIHGNLDFALHIPGNIYLLFFIFSLSFTKIKKSIRIKNQTS